MITLSPDATLFHADCRDALRALPSDSLDSCCTDPPYNLNFMGKAWDTSEVAMDPEFWAEVYRVLKPGAHLAAFGATRQYHRMACAIEDAGFEIRDSLAWIYGSGFPKSHDVSKGIDKTLGAERQRVLVPSKAGNSIRRGEGDQGVAYGDGHGGFTDVSEPITALATEWEGWGTALKPAFEPIVLARKPLSEGTVAANVLRWRTGALNIGASRIPGAKPDTTRGASSKASSMVGTLEAQGRILDDGLGRWPANVVHDGSDEVVGAFPHTGASSAAVRVNKATTQFGFGDGKPEGRLSSGYAEPAGSAARFFYSAKASRADRNGSKHPTVKPIALMEWLATLITPPGGTVLDPFAGSGTTGIAAVRKGFRVVLVEREAEYVRDIRARFPAGRPVIDLAAFRREIALAEEVRALQSRLRQGRVSA